MKKLILFALGLIIANLNAGAQNIIEKKIGFTSHEVDIFDGGSDIWVADINHDGFKDLIATSYNDGICWWRNDSNMNFIKNRIASTAEQPFARSIRATLHDGSIVDFNNDGFVDFVSAAMNNNQVALWLNDSVGNFTKIVIDTLSYGAHTVDVVDFDDDNDLDILIAAFGNTTLNGEFAIYYNDGNMQFAKQILHHTITTGGTFIHSGDVDNDGDLDILFTEYHWSNPSDMGWYKNNDTAFEKIIIAQYKGFHTGILKDFDKDGDLDILAAAYNGSKFFLYLNSDSGNFTKTWESTGAGAIWLDMADLDNDSINDLVGAAQNSTSYPDLYWYSNNGQNVFTPYTINSGLKQVHCVTTDDLDNDGDQDIIIVANESDKVIWYENDCANTNVKEYLQPTNNIIHLYPNPTVSDIKISFSIKEKSRVKLTITDIYGKLIQIIYDEELTAGNYEKAISTENLDKGIYLCNFASEKEYHIQKFLIR